MARLEGKVALVTGAASGIGRASAKLFAREGAKVVCFDRAPAVEETAQMIVDAGGEAVWMTGDAGLEADVAKAVETAVSKFGKLDITYANAGVSGGYSDMFELTADHWAEILRINLIGPFLAIKHSAKAMMPNHKGSIICTASVAGIRSGAGPIPYSASKAGVINLVQTTAQVLTGTGIRVNAICPRPDRDRHDPAHLRPRPRKRHRSQDRPAQPATARRRAGGNRRRGPCSWRRMTARTWMARRSWLMAAYRVRTRWRGGGKRYLLPREKEGPSEAGRMRVAEVQDETGPFPILTLPRLRRGPLVDRMRSTLPGEGVRYTASNSDTLCPGATSSSLGE